MIKIEGLSYFLGDCQALDNVCLTVENGTIMGLVGVNGAGKSTLLRLLAGVYRADSGAVLYDNGDVCDESTRRDIFFLPDEPYYTHQDTMKSIINMYKHFYPSFDIDTYSRLVRELDIDEKKPLRACSKGMRRQIYIAIAISVRPKYLLLDEAFDGLDPLARKVFKEHIAALVDQSGTGVLISSHSLRELEDFCDSFVLIDDHTVKSYGDISEHVERLCKFELAFTHTVTNEFFADIPACSVNVRGKFATVVMEGEPEKCMELLRGLSPVIMDQVAVDFEEAFIHDVNKDRGVL